MKPNSPKQTTLATKSAFFFFTMFLLVSACQTTSAATFTVDTLADDGTKTACTAAPDDCSLRGAMRLEVLSA